MGAAETVGSPGEDPSAGMRRIDRGCRTALSLETMAPTAIALTVPARLTAGKCADQVPDRINGRNNDKETRIKG